MRCWRCQSWMQAADAADRWRHCYRSCCRRSGAFQHLVQRQNHQIAVFAVINQHFTGVAQHFFHRFDVQTLAGNLRRGFVFRQDLSKASHFTRASVTVWVL